MICSEKEKNIIKDKTYDINGFDLDVFKKDGFDVHM